jgi:hypothetical protein
MPGGDLVHGSLVTNGAKYASAFWNDASEHLEHVEGDGLAI